jgi:hypothetical protein
MVLSLPFVVPFAPVTGLLQAAKVNAIPAALAAKANFFPNFTDCTNFPIF